MEKQLGILRDDPWLEPFAAAIEGRHEDVLRKKEELTANTRGSLKRFANAYNYFGLHKEKDGWVFREYAPNATAIHLMGTFNDWRKDDPAYALTRLENGNWEGKFPADAMKNGDLYKMFVEWDGGCGERIPAYARRVVQDEQTHIFSAEIYAPENPYEFKIQKFTPDTKPLLI